MTRWVKTPCVTTCSPSVSSRRHPWLNWSFQDQRSLARRKRTGTFVKGPSNGRVRNRLSRSVLVMDQVSFTRITKWFAGMGRNHGGLLAGVVVQTTARCPQDAHSALGAALPAGVVRQFEWVLG